MKLMYSHNPTNPITSTEDFIKRRSIASATQDWQDFGLSLPDILISRCPYCNNEVWMEAGLIFSLTDNFWFRAYSDGREDVVTPDSLCNHIFCVDGALNLNGNQPKEAKKWHKGSLGKNWDYIWIASEVPFVKPRVLNLPTMLAVVHSFPVANEKYTAYPIVYFAEQQPDETEYCVAWATKKHFATGVGPGVNLIGTRLDEQDYNFEKWSKRNLIYWLDLSIENHPLQSQPFKDFPYHQILGRQHPYIIEEGTVRDLPAPKQGEAEYILEHDSMI